MYQIGIDLFESLASSTRNWLADSLRLGLGFSEDTVSDLNMVSIARSSLGGVRVGRVTKRQERFVGFDWMWLISAPGVGKAIYVVQAKKMRLDVAPSYAYGSLKYPARPPYQIDALQDFASAIGAIPLYCFYNLVDDAEAIRHWHCFQPADPPQMGCTLVPLDAVREVHDGTGKRDFHRVHQYQCAVPWRCLFHDNCSKFSFQMLASNESDNNDLNMTSGARRDAAFEYLAGSLSNDIVSRAEEKCTTWAEEFRTTGLVPASAGWTAGGTSRAYDDSVTAFCRLPRRR